MKKLAFLIITSMIASNSFAFPFYKKQQIPQTMASQKYNTEFEDFSGVWVGICRGVNSEEEDERETRLTITQNKKQISLMIDYNERDLIVLNLNQLSSQSSSSYRKRDAAVQLVDASRNTLLIHYESIAQQGTSKTGNSLFITSLHVNIIKKGETLELQAIDPSNSTCILEKAG